MKRIILLVLSFFVISNLYAITYDDATRIDPRGAIAHDIIKVTPAEISRYCDFDAQIVRLPGKTSSAHVYYECTYIGEKRKILK